MFLCYKRPADFDLNGCEHEALPLGNGRIGARVFGGFQNEMIQFNESSLFSGDSEVPGSYQAFGELFFNFNTPVPAAENTYLRDLDLDTGSAFVALQKGRRGQNRHYIVSAADNIFAARFESTCDEMIDVTIQFQSEQNGSVIYSENSAVVSGTVNSNDGIGQPKGEDANNLGYYCEMRIAENDGKIELAENGIRVYDSFSFTLIMSVATNKCGLSPIEYVKSVIGSCSDLDFKTLFRRHLNQYRKIMTGWSLNIGQNAENITTDSLIKFLAHGKYVENTQALLYEYGKYLLFASAYSNPYPIPEGGIWNTLNHPEKEKLIDLSSKFYCAYNLAKKLSMLDYISVREQFPFENIRINPYGYKTEADTAENRNKKTSLFHKKQADIKTDLPKILTDKKYTVESILKSAVNMSKQNLIFSDISDNIFYSDFVADLLLKKIDDHIEILPGLNSAWPFGSLKNALIDNLIFNIEWSGFKFKKGSVTALKDTECRISFKGKYIAVCDEDGNDINADFDNGIVSFTVPLGKTYTIF